MCSAADPSNSKVVASSGGTRLLLAFSGAEGGPGQDSDADGEFSVEMKKIETCGVLG